MAKIVVGNWKMHGDSKRIEQLLSQVRPALYPLETEVIVCPSFPFLSFVHGKLKHSRLIKLGAQDVSAHQEGAYTGEVAASMLQEIGCEVVLVGHSECRMYHHDTDEMIAAKLNQAIQAGLVPILCVGETLAEREAGETDKVLKQQLKQALTQLIISKNSQTPPLMLAYEPVWAIGTGKNAAEAQIEAVHTFIRETLMQLLPKYGQAIPLLYGGSVNSKNAGGILALPAVDGALVGGASLIAEEFIKICELAHVA